MKKLFITILVLILVSPSFAGWLTRTEDEDGWTEFSPSSDSDVVYISAVDGNNTTCDTYRISDDAWEVSGTPFKPDSGEIIPCEDWATAYAKTSDNSPDWILFKRGETFTESGSPALINDPNSGKDGDEPFLISAYGTSGGSPIINTGTTMAVRMVSDVRYFAVVGLDFYAKSRNPGDGGSLQAGDVALWIYGGAGEYMSEILIEGCKFRWYEGNITLEAADETATIDLEFRRNIIADNYSTASHNQGIYSYNVDTILLEQNLFIHNGWYVVSSGNGTDQSGGQATIYNHCIYCNSTQTYTINENIFIDPSAACIKLTRQLMTTSTNINNNLFIGGEYGISAGNNYQDPEHAYHFPSLTIQNNIYTNTGRDNHTNTETGQGLWVCGIDDGYIRNNLFINSDSVATNSIVFGTNSDESRDTTWDGNISYNYGDKFGLRIATGSVGSSNIVFSNNKLNLAGISDQIIYSGYSGVQSEWSFADNTYYDSGGEAFWTTSEVNLSTWNSWASDNSTWNQTSFTDNTRDIDTYMQSLSETATFAAFITACRNQDRWTGWHTKYMADNVNDWIRTGFDLSEYGAGGGTGAASGGGSGSATGGGTGSMSAQ